MPFSKNRNLSPVIPAETPDAAAVLATIEHVGLDPDHTCVVGSAALAIYGVRLPSDPLLDQPRQRPGDVDYASTLAYMQAVAAEKMDILALADTQRLGSALVAKFDTHADEILPVDIIHRGNGRRTRATDAKIRQHIAGTPTIDGMDVRISPIATIENELLRRAQFDPKAAADLAALKRHAYRQVS